MVFDLEIGGRVRRVRVAARDGRWEIAVDDRVFDVDHRGVGGATASLLVREDGGPPRSIDATVTPRAGGAGFDVLLDGHTLPAALVSRFGRRVGEAAAGGSGPQQVVAPMPGKIVKLLVAPGDAVEPRQGLVVIEAMKMENELRASRAGRVKAVKVAEGQSVEAGVLLVTVE
ncbi:MAG: acetyl-CoA carboxylase biotin carboxyl carrier protein subunit [Acidobacteria bacterium]|nr:acetyl-CoA carboxylase biotin carboxyl carrier protein subunit [Acidobacteriota bacterium]